MLPKGVTLRLLAAEHEVEKVDNGLQVMRTPTLRICLGREARSQTSVQLRREHASEHLEADNRVLEAVARRRHLHIQQPDVAQVHTVSVQHAREVQRRDELVLVFDKPRASQ